MIERPLCDICDMDILDDHYYRINGDAIRPSCMEEYFRKELTESEDADE